MKLILIEAFDNHLGANFGDMLFGKLRERKGNLPFRPAGFHGFVSESLECSGKGLPTILCLIVNRHKPETMLFYDFPSLHPQQ